MEIKTITVFKRNDFRKWLKKNHKKEKRVCVILYKRHTGKPAPTHRELIEEAICFGWIDTTIKKIDEERFLRNFSRRNKNSRWSENTLGYAKELKKKRRMSSEGLKFYKLGLEKPTHDYGIPKNPEMPSQLNRALGEDKKAMRNFDKFPPSTKRMLYRWMIRAKLPETREKRTKIIVKSAREGKKDFR